MFRILLFLVISNFSTGLVAHERSAEFHRLYFREVSLSVPEVEELSDFDFYLVPGILSESFTSDDRRSRVNLARLTKDYFYRQKDVLEAYGFRVRSLPASSKELDQTRAQIRRAFQDSQFRGRKTFFIAHSLGGIALLEEMLAHADHLPTVGGVIFLQTPFSGSSVADTYLRYPYWMDRWLKPILPFLNTSEETILNLSTAHRVRFLLSHQEAIQRLLSRIRILTLGGVANGHPSLFHPSIELMERGCLLVLRSGCLSRVVFPGPYDLSDGMVPRKSSRLLDAGHVELAGVDHGELVVRIPHQDFEPGALTLTLLKMITKEL